MDEIQYQEPYRITFEELGSSKSSSIKTRELIRNLREYNFDAIYQRGSEIWTKKMKQDLIVSMICNIPVGWVHIIGHPTNVDYWIVCDGKQRWKTVEEFVEGKFSFPWGNTMVSYNDLRTHDELKELYVKFNGFLWETREWPTMPILKQRDLFERINAMSSLNTHERLYCINFFAKSYLMYAHEIVKKYLGERMTNPLEKNKRFAGLAWTHCLLYSCFGHDCRGDYTSKHPTQKMKKTSAVSIDDIFRNHFGEEGIKQDARDGNLITEEALKSVNMFENMELLQKTVQHIKIVLSFDAKVPFLKQKMDQNAIKDIIIWMMNHFRNKTITPSQVREQRGKFFQVFKTFVETRAEKKLTQNQTNKQKKIEAFNYLDNLCDALQINMEEKCIALTQIEKDEAMSRCNGFCPNCNCRLTPENVHFDHVECKSKHSKTIACCICDHCNLRKSNWTSNELAKYHDYVIDQLSSNEQL